MSMPSRPDPSLSASWWHGWGGRLSDGTYVVVNPAEPPLRAIYDLTADEKPPLWSEEPSGPRGLWHRRVRRIGPLTLPYPPLIRSVALSLLIWASVSAILLLAPPSPAATLAWCVVALLLALVAVFWSEGNPLRQGFLTIVPSDAPSSADSPLRYVPVPVAATGQFRLLLHRMSLAPAGSPYSQAVHEALWRAADLRVYSDIQEVLPEDMDMLNTLLLAAESFRDEEPPTGP